jgi:hypothetical protein
MVSSTLDLDHEWLTTTLERLRTDCADDPEYVELRAAFPEDWPL